MARGQDPSTFTSLSRIHQKPVQQCLFSPDTDQILTGSEDCTIVLWNLPPREIQLHDDTINDEHKLHCYRLKNHLAPIMSISLHKKLFISASKDGKVKLWKFSSDKSTYNYINPSDISHIHKHQSTTSIQSTAVQYRPNTYKKPLADSITYICSTKGIIRSVELSQDAKKFASGCDDKSVEIWSTESINKKLISYKDGHSNWIKSVRWSKTNETTLASCGDDGKVCIWDIRTQGPNLEVVKTKKRMQFNCLDWHPVFEHHLATGAQDSSCSVWDLRNRKQIQVYLHNGSVNSVAFNPGGSLLLTGSSDKTSKIFDVCQGTNLYVLKSHSRPVTSVCFNPTGELIATGSQDNTVTVWKRNFNTIDIELAEDESSVLLVDDGQGSEYLSNQDSISGMENVQHRQQVYFDN